MRPQTGGRVSLALVSAGPDGVLYEASLFLPDADFEGSARIDAAGTVTVEAGGPDWLLDYLKAFLRGEWRSRQGPDPPPWPDRITRWRSG